MNNSITISYPSKTSDEIEVHYSIEQLADIQTINCEVSGRVFPFWLQLRKFSLASMVNRNGYTALFCEVNSSKNMDTSLFIDLVYSSIMKLENYKCS